MTAPGSGCRSRRCGPTTARPPPPPCRRRIERRRGPLRRQPRRRRAASAAGGTSSSRRPATPTAGSRAWSRRRVTSPSSGWPTRNARCCWRSERAARSEAERAARIKDDFVSTLSHELRTPLNAILGWVGVLRQDQKPETLAKAHRRHRPQLAPAVADDRRPARHGAHPVGQDAPRGAARRAGDGDRGSHPVGAAVGRCQGRAPAEDARLGGHRARRPRTAAAGGVEPAEQRHQVHAARRPGAGDAAQGQQSRARAGERHRRRASRPDLVGARLRTLPPGRCLDHAAPRRPGPGPVDRQEPRRTARRLGGRGERRREQPAPPSPCGCRWRSPRHRSGSHVEAAGRPAAPLRDLAGRPARARARRRRRRARRRDAPARGRRRGGDRRRLGRRRASDCSARASCPTWS